MNTINTFFQHATSGFWVFVGTYMILLVTLKIAAALIFKCWNRLLRTIKVALRGWPPAHIDADGDAITVHQVQRVPPEPDADTWPKNNKPRESFTERIARLKYEKEYKQTPPPTAQRPPEQSAGFPKITCSYCSIEFPKMSSLIDHVKMYHPETLIDFTPNT